MYLYACSRLDWWPSIYTCTTSIGGCCDIKKPFYGDIPWNWKEKGSTNFSYPDYFTYPIYPCGIVAKGVQIIELALYSRTLYFVLTGTHTTGKATMVGLLWIKKTLIKIKSYTQRNWCECRDFSVAPVDMKWWKVLFLDNFTWVETYLAMFRLHVRCSSPP